MLLPRCVVKPGPPAAFAAPLRVSHRPENVSPARLATSGRRRIVTRAASASPAAVVPGDDSQQYELPSQGQEPVPGEVFDLAPHHWREHLSKLKRGERTALRRYIQLAARISALGPAMQALTDEQLAAQTGELRAALAAAGLVQGSDSSDSRGSSGGSSSTASGPLLGGLPEALVLRGFAVVREAAARVLGMRHYDVQLLGGLALHEGRVAEMATGEGKTLVASLPAYVHALTGKGVHIVTVNAYLARRDAEWIGKVFRFLGLSVGVLTDDSTTAERMAALAQDVTYTTAGDLAFTYLRDCTALAPGSICIRRPLHYALVDEVDSVLIDEAVNPFIISSSMAFGVPPKKRWQAAIEVAERLQQGTQLTGMAEEEVEALAQQVEALVQPEYLACRLTARGMLKAVWLLLGRGLLQLRTDAHGRLAVVLLGPVEGGPLMQGSEPVRLTVLAADVSTGGGRPLLDATLPSMGAVAEQLQGLGLNTLLEQPSGEQLQAAVPAALWGGPQSWGSYLNTALRALHCYKRDVQYIVRDNRVVIIDTPTGRERSLSVWQAGLHQAVEVKEGVQVTAEMDVAAQVAFQTLFGSYYRRLAGMTGTGATEALEFSEAYGLDVVRVPPHRPSRRTDHPLSLYYFREGRNYEVESLLLASLASSQPVLIGTGSVEESNEMYRVVTDALERQGMGGRTVSLLNARPEYTRREAAIIAQAGLPGSVTIATNVAGRGTDILLGGNPKGLVALLLGAKLLPLLAKGAQDAHLFESPLPLAGLSTAFLSDDHMAAELPPAVYAAYADALQQLAAVVARSEAQGASAPGGRLPWRKYSAGASQHAARDATDWLAQQVEAAEQCKAQLRLSECLGLPDCFEEADRRVRAEQQQRPANGSGSAGDGADAVQQATAALQRFMLLQWLWFDRACSWYASKVRAVGGLRVVITSFPLNRRSELQLRGRAGRQGDPGDSHLVVSYDDPALAVLVKGAGVQDAFLLGSQRFGAVSSADWQPTPSGVRAFVEWAADGLEERPWDSALLQRQTEAWQLLLAKEANPLAGFLRSTLSKAEQNQQVARRAMQEADGVMDAYRRHLYTLRRQVLLGGTATRHRILHRHFTETGQAVVADLIDARQPPSRWPLRELADRLARLANNVPPGGRLPDLDDDTPCSAYLTEDAAVGAYVRVRAPALAAQLHAALQQGTQLPRPEVADPWGDLERRRARAVLDVASIPPRERQQIEAQLSLEERSVGVRLRTSQQLVQLRADAAAAAAAWEMGGGRYAPAARQLAAWVAEWLAVQHRNRREVLKTWLRSPDYSPGGLSEAEAEGALAVAERDTLLLLLDALWGDFLMDTGRVQRVAQARAYSAFTPLDEFKLESGRLFTCLLADLRRQSVESAFEHLRLEQLEKSSPAGGLLLDPEALDPSAGSASSGSGSRGAGSQAAEEAAMDAAMLLDACGLQPRIDAESEQRAAAVVEAVDAEQAGDAASEKAHQVTLHAAQLRVLAAAVHLEVAQAATELPSDPPAGALLQQARGRLADVKQQVEQAGAACERAAAVVQQAGAQVDAWLEARQRDDSVASAAAVHRLQQAASCAGEELRRVSALYLRCEAVAGAIRALLTEARAATPQDVRDRNAALAAATPVVQAALAQAQQELLQEQAAERLAGEALQAHYASKQQQQQQQQRPSAASPVAFGSGLVSGALQQAAAGGTDLPSAVKAAITGRPEQQSSAAIGEALAARSSLEAQAAQLSPQAAGEAAAAMDRLTRAIQSADTLGEAIAALKQVLPAERQQQQRDEQQREQR